MLVVIGTDCIGIYKSNYHMLMTTMAPAYFEGMLNYEIIGQKILDIVYIIKWQILCPEFHLCHFR
jgi:hypothetical protein